MIYLLDTNAISDMLADVQIVIKRMFWHQSAGDIVGLIGPVYYETWRGLLARQSLNKMNAFNVIYRPVLQWFDLTPEDWKQAAEFWADARAKGRQLADPDLLLAALAKRLNAVLVSSDADYDALPVTRENWRT